MRIESTIKTRHRFIEIRKLLEQEINKGHNDVRETTSLTKAWDLINQGVADFYEAHPSPFMYAGMNFIVDSDIQPGVIGVTTHDPLAPTAMAALANAVKEQFKKLKVPLANRMVFCVHCNKAHTITDGVGKPIPLPDDCKWRLELKNATGGGQ